MGVLQNQREGARDTGSWGPLPGQRFTDLCLINTLIFFFFFLSSWESSWITCSVVEFRLWEGLFYLSLVSLITPVARMLFPDCSPAWRPALPSGYGSYSSFCHTGSGGPGTWTSLGLNFCTSAFFSAAVASLHSVQRELILKLLRQKKYVIFPVP